MEPVTQRRSVIRLVVATDKFKKNRTEINKCAAEPMKALPIIEKKKQHSAQFVLVIRLKKLNASAPTFTSKDIPIRKGVG